MEKLNRKILSVLIIWTFIHTYLLIINISTEEIPNFILLTQESYSHKPTHYFYPFTARPAFLTGKNFDSSFYDYTEFFVYVVGAWTSFVVYNLLSTKNK